MERKIAAITPSFNQAHLLLPHLEWLSKWVDKIIVVQGDVWKNPVAEHLVEPDNSLELLQEHFPEIEVMKDRTSDFCGDLYNQALEKLEDYDVATRFDTDMFMTEKDSERFFNFLRTSDYDYYPLDFSRCSVNYYLDLKHGLKDALEFDPLAISTQKRFEALLGVTGKEYLIDWPDFILHHLKHVGKKKEPTLEFLNSPKAQEWVEKYTPQGKWLELPEELTNLYNKWQKY